MKSDKPKIVFIHSLNNFTGSPNVLSVVIRGFIAKGYRVELFTSKGEGFLSNIPGVKYRYTCYQWLNNQWKTAMFLLLSQIEVFFKILFLANNDTIYYINTIIPFGAAWACKLSGKTFVYHVHENMQQEKAVYGIFRYTYIHCNRKSIFVSHFLKTTALKCRNGIVVYNGLNKDFLEKAKEYLSNPVFKKIKGSILMVSSLRKFKGIYEFVELARRLPHYNFELVLSASDAEIRQFGSDESIPDNLIIYSAQKSIHPFYQRAGLILQLSHPELWVETFGLTILEAMVYGIPALVPNVGGPTELVEHGLNGYQINPHDIPDIASKIGILMTDENLYSSFSKKALEKSEAFSEVKMVKEIENYILI